MALRLSPVAIALMDELAESWGVGRSQVLELIVRQTADEYFGRDGLSLPEFLRQKNEAREVGRG